MKAPLFLILLTLIGCVSMQNRKTDESILKLSVQIALESELPIDLKFLVTKLYSMKA